MPASSQAADPGLVAALTGHTPDMKHGAVWIGAIVFALILSGGGVIAISTSRKSAAAGACSTTQLLGRAPAGYAYRRPDAASRKKLITTLKQQDAPHGADIRLLIRGDQSVGYVLIEPQ